MSSSLAPECSEKKERYDTCFIKWYSESMIEFRVYYLLRLRRKEYLRGEGSTDECAELFKEYKSCLNAALKQKGIHNMIEEARKTSPNNNNVKGLK